MQPSILRSAPPTRDSSPAATSSTQSRSCTKASWRPAACPTRSALSSPRIVRCAARTRRSLTLSTITHTSATSAPPAAASATIPCVEFRSSTAARVSGSAREDDRELALVVVRDGLAGHRLDPDDDGHVLAGGRLAGERDGRGLQLPRGDLGDRLLEVERVASGADLHGHGHIGLGALAMVQKLKVERDVTRQRHRGGTARS